MKVGKYWWIEKDGGGKERGERTKERKRRGLCCQMQNAGANANAKAKEGSVLD